MISLSYDLHLHSCLSPCGDELMTPNNIVNMAHIKELDMIAVCDHNSALNLPAVAAIANALGLLLIPGIEAESREEVHVLCYMPTIDAALELSDILYDALPDVKNNPKFFGEQSILNDDDEQTGVLSKLLIQSTRLSLEELFKTVRMLDGVPVPAHINRTSNSMLVNMGFIPPDLAVKTVEVYNSLPISYDISDYHTLYSSDAHNLEAIHERNTFIKLKERSVKAFLEKIGS